MGAQKVLGIVDTQVDGAPDYRHTTTAVSLVSPVSRVRGETVKFLKRINLSAVFRPVSVFSVKKITSSLTIRLPAPIPCERSDAAVFIA